MGLRRTGRGGCAEGAIVAMAQGCLSPTGRTSQVPPVKRRSGPDVKKTEGSSEPNEKQRCRPRSEAGAPGRRMI